QAPACPVHRLCPGAGSTDCGGGHRRARRWRQQRGRADHARGHRCLHAGHARCATGQFGAPLMTDETTNRNPTPTEWFARWHIDLPLLIAALLCITLGLFVLYSASNRSVSVVIEQGIRFGIGLVCMMIAAQLPPDWYRLLAPPGYVIGLVLLLLVLVAGDSAFGAQRWLHIGPLRFQPSEVMKLAVPLMVAVWFHDRPVPPRLLDVAMTAIIVMIPVGLVAYQPDLGTALLICGAGAAVLYLAGLRLRMIGLLALLIAAVAPLVWINM